MSLEFILEFINKKRSDVAKNIGTLETLSSQSASKKIADLLSADSAESSWGKALKSPIGKLGKTFVTKQIASQTKTLFKNIDTSVTEKIDSAYGPLRSKLVNGNKAITDANSYIKESLEQTQNAVFDTITAAVTAQNNLAMYFIQQQSKQILVAIDTKNVIVVNLQERLREVYNILMLISSSDPFFDAYLAQLRAALVAIHTARTDLTVIHNTLYTTNTWLHARFEQTQTGLKQAEALMNPPSQKNDVDFSAGALISSPLKKLSKSEEASLLLALPQKIKEVLVCANGYFIATMKLNSLLLLFIQAQGSFSSAASRKIKQFTLNSIETIVKRLDELVLSMAIQLNGGPEYTDKPKIQPDGRAYDPDPVRASAEALSWVIELRSIIQFMEVIPGNNLNSINMSNLALQKYEFAVTELKKKNNRSQGDSVLTAVEGREEPGQFERQLTRFMIGATKSVKKPKEGVNVLTLGRTLINRLDLTIAQDREIREIISGFANADLEFAETLKKSGSSIYKMLDKFGLDRAADLLRNGDYAKFFNLDSKTATYAGAAISAFSVLKECLTTQEDREQLTQAQREVEREVKSKELIAQRSASKGFEKQVAEIKTQDFRLETLSERTQVSARKCGLPTDMMPSNLIKALGPVVGLGVIGNKTISQNLDKLGKGIL